MGLEQLFNQLLRPKLRNLVPEIYKDISYVLDDDSYTAAEYQNVVRKRFIKTWETCMDGYKVASGLWYFGLANLLDRMRLLIVTIARSLAWL